jgi:hypothetical protein
MADNAVLKKLAYKGEDPALVIGAPDEFRATMRAFAGKVDEKPVGRYGFVLVFVRSGSDLTKLAPGAAASLEGDGRLWFGYPKKSSRRYQTDISRDSGWTPLGKLGFEPVSQVAIDDDWSALRFRRVEQIRTLTRHRALSAAGKKRIGGR